MDDIPVGAFQLSIGNTSHYLDEGYEPLFPFGFGLSYSEFSYSDIRVDREQLSPGEKVTISAQVSNTGAFDAEEVVQLYVRDLFADRTRPVRELKGFKREFLKQGETRRIRFDLSTDDLAFHNTDMEYVTEPGQFQVWIGGDSNAELTTYFELLGE
jgi:beta-glucosidase